MSDNLALQFILTAKDEASAVIDQFSQKAQAAEGRMAGITKASQLAAGAVAAAGAAALTGLAVASNEAIQFETQMTNVATLISGDATPAVNELSDGVLEMAKRMPKSVDELGGSLYDILSAGIQGSSNQLKVLESSAKLAVAGLGDTAGATDIMTSAINAFQLDAKDAEQIADTLFQTVKYGKTTVDQMSQSFGATAPTIAAAGFRLDEFSAATAALTTTGMPASQAQNSLRQTVVALTKPTKEMSELFQKLGYEDLPAYVQAMKDADEGDVLGSLLRGINEAADGNAETLTKAFGSVEAYSAALGIGVTVSDAYVTALNTMGGSTVALNEAFDKQKETVANSGQVLKNNLEVIGIQVGSVLLPKLAELSNWVVDKVIPAIQDMAAWLDNNRPVLYGVAAALTVAVIPAIYGLVGSIVAATLAASPWILIIGAVAIAIGLLTYAVTSNWDSIKGAFVTGVNWITDKMDKLVAWFQGLPDEWKKWGGIIGKAFIEALMGPFAGLPDLIWGALDRAKKYLEGHSPPIAGPFKDIDEWGYSVGNAWVGGLQSALSQNLTPATLTAGTLGGPGAGTPLLSSGGVTNNSPITINQNIYSDVDLDRANQELLFMLENRTRY